MNMLLETLASVGSHPVPWICVLIVALGALVAARKCQVCEHLDGSAEVDLADAQARLDRPFVAGPAYALSIILGIIAMLTGLALIAASIAPVTAFVVLTVGIVTVQIAPIMLRLSENYDRVIAAQAEGMDAVEFARERLRSSYSALIAMSLAISLIMAIGLLTT